MEVFRKIAEQRIQEAIESGELDNLRGSGRPLKLDDDAHIPEDLRISYRVLKNAGCIPPELELRNEIVSLRSLIDTIDDDMERMKRIRELNFKIMKLGEMRKRPLNLDGLAEYEQKLCERFL